jgi:hypothetical protein
MVTSIKQIINASRYSATLQIVDTLTNTTLTFAPLEVRSGLGIWIPWADQSTDYSGHHILLTVGSRQFAVWQTNSNSRVRLASAPWVNPNQPWSATAGNIFGVSIAEGDRAMVINAWGPLLEPRTSIWDLLPELATERLRDFGKSLLPPVYYLSWTGSPSYPPTSTPKLSATAFSMAGNPSDALDRGSGSARFQYRDSGKRYEYWIRNGVVYVKDPDGSELALNLAVSYDAKRLGEYSAPPPFDMVAASAGRVLAKVQGTDRLYFALMDEMFVDSSPAGEFGVPPIYFKLDPEWNLDAANPANLTNTADLTMHLTGDFGSTPYSERFLLFRLAQELAILQALIVRVRRHTWHLIDTRPPVNANPLAALASSTTPGWDFSRLMQPIDMPAPPGIPTYKHVEYAPAPPGVTLPRSSIDFDQVLDIGVGAVHFHDQYETVTGGELQPLRSRPLAPFPGGDYAMTYRLFNGPIRDADGYCDGTVNYYILVRLVGTSSYRILYIDEQMFFTQRWRAIGPDDHAGLTFALTVDLDADTGRPLFLQRYLWVPANYWDPFTALPASITPQSRMAVAAQVILVTGVDPAQGPVIYSINFSYGTMDRSWRWRTLPVPARYLTQAQVDAGDDTISTTDADTIYPQTIRLREDMTIHMKGARRRIDGVIEAGRWYQRYLPANNKPFPEDKGTPGQPGVGYPHIWKFLPEKTFALADKFSHFGIYASVNSRTQYYVVTPRPGDEATLDANAANPWTDQDRRLYIVAWKFPWDGRLHAREAWRPPSQFNTETRLVVARRGSLGWIATHWDKRDDDMMPFDGLPADVLLTQAGAIGVISATITVQSNILVEQPPVVSLVQFSANSAGDVSTIHFVTPQLQRTLTNDQKARLTANPRAFVLENVWRIRMAAFSGTGTVMLLDLTTESFTPVGDFVSDFEYQLTLTPDQQAALRGFCTVFAAAQLGTTIWFEDIVGHVAPPQEVHWLPSMFVSVQPSPIRATGTVQITVNAKDDSGQNISGTVNIAGNPSQPTNTAFNIYLTSSTPPAGTVSANGYATAPIPWPQLIVSTYSAGFADIGSGIGGRLL